MPPAANRIYLAARAILDAVVAGYAAAGVALPDRQYISHGPPAWDCSLLAVYQQRGFGHSGNIATETLEPILPHSSHVLRGALFAVELVRCYPDVDSSGTEVVLPSAAAMEAGSEELLIDEQLIHNSLLAAEKAGQLGTACHEVAYGDWQPLGPMGGLAGGLLVVRVGLTRG